MNAKILLTSFLICLLFAGKIHAQVTIGSDANPDNSSLLDIKNQSDNTSNKGFLMPRVVISDTAIFGLNGNTLTAGMTVYNTVSTSKNNGIGHYYWNGTVWKKLITSGEPADNLGNHTATKTLNMATNNIDNIKNAFVNNEVQIRDRVTANANYFGLYKNNGSFGIWNSNLSTNSLSIDEVTDNTTLTSATISKGTDGIAPQTGYIATSQDNRGGVVWMSPKSVPGAIENVYEFLGSTAQEIAKDAISPIVPKATITLAKSATLLITYSALPLPAVDGVSVQGSIDLVVDDVKQISSYYSATDGKSLVRLGNYSTAQRVMINMAPGEHTVTLQAKSWDGTTLFNINPYPQYIGSLPDDKDAMTSRLTIIVFNQ